MFDREHEQKRDGVFVLLLFALFSGCILMVLLLEINTYRNLVSRDDETFNRRTASQYLAAKIRHSEEQEGLYVGTFSNRLSEYSDEVDTLYLRYDSNYYTKIYYYKGYIREMLVEEGDELDPLDGEEIIKAKGMKLVLEDDLLKMEIKDEKGAESAIYLKLRCQEVEHEQP